MKLVVENRFALLGLVMVALSALFGVALVTSPASGTDAAGPAERARVESAVRACPPPQGDDDSGTIAAYGPADGADKGKLTAAANPAAPEEDDDGAVPSPEPIGRSGQPGTPWTAEPGDSGTHTVVRATGGLAAGVELTQATLGKDEKAVTEVRCPEPGLSTWFAAPGGDDLKDLRLHAGNPDDSAATVNVDVYATDGPAVSKETRGIAVAPNSDAEIDLGPLVESTGAVGVHVRTASGRVAASLFAEKSKRGADWVPPANPPATTHVIPGVPEGGGDRRLIVAAPGEDPADVKVRAFTPDGEADHDALESLDVPPSASAELSLEGPLDKKPATIVVTATRPVVAAVAMSRSDGDDTAYTAAVDPLEGGLNSTAVVPSLPKDTDSELLIGAPEKAATVRVTPVAADGSTGDPKETKVKAGRTEPVKVGADAAALVVEAVKGSGPAYAARVLKGDGATSVLPLPPAPAEIALPSVSDSLTSVVR
ncbi:hypothetical protein CLV63_10993 [Murinocardiopsis flavida]|uniref:Secreted protein n=1 Tax=Murinocardiopsis flavida TaxID=645275 RepID=A0A2P8DIN8_9ACTN|nr:DUF5719 family protein [Murinocardiopsis flavida]PSK97090.1 hypothetical protein CLV63_10993 [Murinocardiopsis flavida]